jgi:hypothetical protein
MQKVGLLSINAWANDGFTKVFWRDEPVVQLWPQVLVLLAIGVVLVAVAREIALRWEYPWVRAWKVGNRESGTAPGPAWQQLQSSPQLLRFPPSVKADPVCGLST